MIDKKYITHRREPFYEIAKLHIAANDRVLDIGAGNGTFAKYCQKTDFYLFDGNIDTVEYLKEEYPNAVLGNLPTLPFADDFFHLIHCSHVVEHLHPELFYETLKEMNRCLKVGGTLVISAPLMWSGFYNDLSHVRPYNPKVYHNYLCGEEPNSRTRSVVATNYKQVELVYRFNPPKSEMFYSNTPNKFFARLSSKIFNYLKRKNIYFYEKSGYTIVLRKH